MKQMPSKTMPLVKGLVTGLVAGGVVLLLFGLVGKSWLVGLLAGLCTLVGFFLIGFAWSYLKAVEGYYKAHPERKDPSETMEE